MGVVGAHTHTPKQNIDTQQGCTLLFHTPHIFTLTFHTPTHRRRDNKGEGGGQQRGDGGNKEEGGQQARGP